LTISIAPLAGAAAAPPPPSGPRIHGAACTTDAGVTVAVDFTPILDVVDIRCATPGPSIGDAFTSTGFVTDSPIFASVVDGVAAIWADDVAPAYWSLRTSTQDGTPAGPAATEWVYANEGLAAGPTTAGQAYLLEYIPRDTATGADLKTGPVVPLAQVRAHTVAEAPARLEYQVGSPDAQLAAGWLAGQLDAGGGVLPGSSGTDWGLTIDAMAALAATGVGKDQFEAAAEALYQSGDAYVGARSAAASSWPTIAKTVWALGIAGLDPTRFPVAGAAPRDLVADLRSTIAETGEFATSGFPFTWSLGILALAGTGDGAPVRAVTWLESWQCRDATHTDAGSYGWSDDCSAADPDTTALVIQALAAAGVAHTDPAIADAARWLVTKQDAAGGFASSFGGPNANTTGLASGALHILANDDGESPAAAAVALAATYVAALQVTSATVAAHPSTLRTGDTGAIAVDADGLADAVDVSIDAVNVDQFRRATAQAVFALSSPSLGGLRPPTLPAEVPEPGDDPSSGPSDGPTGNPSDGPTGNPSDGPSGTPNDDPSAPPSSGPGQDPAITPPPPAPPAPAPAPAPVDLQAATVRVSDVAWTGTRITRGFTVTVNGTRLREGIDYTASATKTNTAIGKGRIRLDSKGTAYTGSVTATFRIVPKAVTLTKVAAGHRQVTASWKKAAKAQKITAYQLRYRVKGKTHWSTVKAVKPTAASATIAALARGKAYQVRIRAYKRVGAATYISPWSAVTTSKRTT
jgi:hypothetical protein